MFLFSQKKQKKFIFFSKKQKKFIFLFIVYFFSCIILLRNMCLCFSFCCVISSIIVWRAQCIFCAVLNVFFCCCLPSFFIYFFGVDLFPLSYRQEKKNIYSIYLRDLNDFFFLFSELGVGNVHYCSMDEFEFWGIHRIKFFKFVYFGRVIKWDMRIFVSCFEFFFFFLEEPNVLILFQEHILFIYFFSLFIGFFKFLVHIWTNCLIIHHHNIIFTIKHFIYLFK